MRAQFVTNAGHLAARQRQRAAAVDAAMIAASRQWGETVRQRAIALSRGSIPESVLRTHHPGLYSTVLPASPLFDIIVNRQTGLLERSWRVATWSFTGGVTTTVFNTAWYSGFMDGTARMRQRPILTAAVYGTMASSSSVQPSPSPFTRQIWLAKVRAERQSAYGTANLLGDLVQIGVGVTAVYAGEFF